MDVCKKLSMLAAWGFAGTILGTASIARAGTLDFGTRAILQDQLLSAGITGVQFTFDLKTLPIFQDKLQITDNEIAKLNQWLEQEAKSPYVPTRLGGRLFATGKDVEVKVLPATAGYTSTLFWLVPALKLTGTIGTNREVGKVTNIGSFDAGLEIIFGIFVHNTQKVFMTGPGSRNPDRLPHVNVNSIEPGLAYVGFEDVYGGGDKDYDDNMFEMSGVIGGEPVPEPVTMFGGAVFSAFAVAIKRKRRHQQKALNSRVNTVS